MRFEPSRLRSGEWIAGLAALALFVLTFVGWYSVRADVGSGSGVSVSLSGLSVDAWDAFSLLDILLAATIVAAAGLFFLQGTQRSPALPVSLAVVSTVLAGITALAILYRIIDPPGLDLPARVPSATLIQLSIGTDLGAWLALAATLAVATGSWRSLREEGLAPFDERTEIETIRLGESATVSLGGARAATDAPAKDAPSTPDTPAQGAAPEAPAGGA